MKFEHASVQTDDDDSGTVDAPAAAGTGDITGDNSSDYAYATTENGVTTTTIHHRRVSYLRN